MRKMKVVMLLSVVAALAGLGSGRGQDAIPPALPVIAAPLALEIPRPPSVEQLREQSRARYVSLQAEMAKHLTDAQLQERTAAVEKELAAANERKARAEREQKAKDELAKAREALAAVARDYKGTEAGAKAAKALEQADVIDVIPAQPK